uniref:HTH_Tnp_Tc3_2 domain-containing protein n=1 Tax=Heterorhabditis bacteriophora TaxID=37862 RepID=A0A1I7WBI8_HETBA
MSKGKNITSNQRVMIRVLLDQNLSQVQSAKKLELSRYSVQNATKHIIKSAILENVPRTRRNRNTTERIDGIIRRLSEDNQCSLSVNSIRRRLVEVGLNGRVPRKKPLASLKNRRVLVAFAREHLTWSAVKWTKVIFSNESKFNRFGSDGKKYVRRRPGEEFMPKCKIPTIKHDGGLVMVWTAFNRNGPGPLHIVEGIMDITSYVRILENNLLPYVRSQRLGRNRIFLQDNDPKHSSKATKRWLHRKKITIMEWPSHSPDLNSIEHLRNDVEKEVQRQKPSNIRELEAVIKKAWPQISVQRCANLIDSMPRRCYAVINNFGYPTKY